MAALTQTLHPPPIPLGRPAVNFGGGFPGELAPHLLGLAGGDAFRRFFVKQAGFRCRAAFFREAAHSHLPVGVAIENIEPVADLQFTRRLAGGAVEPDLAAADRIGGEAARLEEARRPQPLVDADASHSGSTDSPA